MELSVADCRKKKGSPWSNIKRQRVTEASEYEGGHCPC